MNMNMCSGLSYQKCQPLNENFHEPKGHQYRQSACLQICKLGGSAWGHHSKKFSIKCTKVSSQATFGSKILGYEGKKGWRF